MHMRFSRSARLSDPAAPPHPVDEVPRPPRLVLLGLQHLAIMYAGAVAVPLLVGGALKLPAHTIGVLINADLLVSGIVTIIQAVGIGRILGVRLPVVAGATFTVVSPMILIAEQFGGGEAGLPTVYGAILVSGVFGLAIARFFAKVVRFFPPLVSGCVICVIGLSLIGADAGLIAGNDPKAADYGQMSHIALAGLVIALIVLIHKFGRGLLSQLAVLISVALGTLVAVPMGLVDLSGVGHAGWFGVSQPFTFGAPQFHVAAIISMCVVMLVTFTESTADMVAVAEMVDKPLEPGDLARGLAADGLSAVLAGVMNSFPDTAFAENVGLVGLTGVRSRWVVAACGGMLVALGLIPKVGSVVAALPGPVVGGAATVMFAMVTAVGLRVLHKVQFEGTNNMLIIAVTLSVALLPAVAPSIYTQFPVNFQMIASSPITSAVIVVFLLNLMFNHWNPRKPAPESVNLSKAVDAPESEDSAATAE
ncbi:MAG: putative xanthine/uracil permease [Nocardia sp.]|uniref:nucleobase:cation symporter-2 family protein n=1 Tax=Nocardia sp. TaxID=1821 RepID=UPI002605B676|nr:nucleobase:cation symporter-2 family protein [Nocardia sp.]MCU1641316.1 putative xanthine/uracil permease [Nocardia sp.]